MEKIKDYSFGFVPVFREVDGKLSFLLIKSCRTGIWCLPKGHPEGDEDELAAARRELLEETGIQNIKVIDGLKYSERFDTEKAGKIIDKTVRYFVGFVEDKNVTIQKKEVSDFRWVTYDEAMKLFTNENPKRILTQVVEDFKKLNI